ncbi:unnamed protein product [Brachionus calyciflorus]|uniref:Uncharacterized protein n=1 Tax=Brachionus calyciflorus TaxID=104777 RepID=A0A813ZDB8_9BILA|nr:unnamed protein product [Brachionus calyciflorus]
MTQVTDEKENEENKNLVPFWKLFRYATFHDWLMIAIGSLGSIGSGISFPIMLLFFSNIIDSFTEYGIYTNCNSTME